MKLRIVALICLCSAGTVSLSAGELNVEHLPATTCWVIHVDLEAARRSDVIKNLLAEWLNRQAAKKKLDEIRRVLGIELATQLQGLTAFDERFEENSGVVMVHLSSVDAGRLIDLLKARRPRHTSEPYRDHTIYAWRMREGSPHEHRVSGCIYKNTIVFSRDGRLVRNALDRLDGLGEGLPADSPLAAEAPAGTIFLARASGMADRPTPFRWKVLDNAHLLLLAAGDDTEGVFVTVRLKAASAEVARHCKELMEGYRAMAALWDNSDQTAQQLLGGLKAQAEGQDVTAEWRVNADEFGRAVERLQKKRAARAKIPGSAPNSPLDSD